MKCVNILIPQSFIILIIFICQVDPVTGMLINLHDLKMYMKVRDASVRPIPAYYCTQ